MKKNKILLVLISIILLALFFAYRSSYFERVQLSVDNSDSGIRHSQSRTDIEYENDPYTGKIRMHFCSKNSAVEVDKMLKYLNSDLDYSEKVLTRIISKDHDCVLAIHTLGTVYSFKKKYDEAFEYYEKALRLAPNAAVIYQSIGTVNFKVGKLGLAIKNLENAIKLEHNMWSAHRGLAVIYKAQGEYKLAKKHYLKVIEIGDDKIYVEQVKEFVRLLEDKGY